MADGPDLLCAHPAAAAALAAAIADHQVPVLAKVLKGQLAAELVKRMVGMRGSDDLRTHQRVAGKALRHL